MRRLLATVAAIAAGALFIAPMQAQATPQDTSYYGSISQSASDAIQAYELANPLDLAGLGRLVQAATGKAMLVTTDDSSGFVSPATAQAHLNSVDQVGPSSPGRVQPYTTLPSNFFAVSFAWVPITGPPRTVVAHGVWNFPDSHQIGASPDDFSSIQTQRGCSSFGPIRTITYNYKNQRTSNAAFLYSSGLSSGAPISEIVDRNSGFVSNADHGYTDVSIQNTGACDTHQVGGSYSYKTEYGGSVVSVSAGWGFLSVTLGGGSHSLQHSTGASYYTL